MYPDFGIISDTQKNGISVVMIDTKIASYQGFSWKSLGDFGKRKFENILVLSRPKERMKITYV